MPTPKVRDLLITLLVVVVLFGFSMVCGKYFVVNSPVPRGAIASILSILSVYQLLFGIGIAILFRKYPFLSIEHVGFILSPLAWFFFCHLIGFSLVFFTIGFMGITFYSVYRTLKQYQSALSTP